MKTLTSYLTSDYISASNALNGKTARRRIIAYVESYDDVFFWRSILSQLETKERFFQVMLPFRNGGKKLERGKKAVLMSAFKDGVGPDMIACVDADYDYLKRLPNEMSKAVCENPYVFHTYAYAIENLQCWAPGLHETCVMVTLMDDPDFFDFEAFYHRYSEIIYPLFVWNILCARGKQHGSFDIGDLLKTIETGKVVRRFAEDTLTRVKKHVDKTFNTLNNAASQKTLAAYKSLDKELRTLGVMPQTTYMFIQGHFLFDHVTIPLMENVCKHLKEKREQEIIQQSKHDTQRQNEIACYEHSLEEIPSMLKKNTAYLRSPYVQQILADLRETFE